jgi:hypothetical protein
MNWSDFYLICFAVGFLLSAISFIAGGLHWHLPFFPDGDGHFHFHADTPGSAAASMDGGHGDGGHGNPDNARGGAHGPHVSPFNFISLTAFLAWFGGTGYLITRYSTIWAGLGLLISLAAGASGAGFVFLFLSRVLVHPKENLDSADYEMAGVLGRTSLPIRSGGTGEIIYSQAGTRRTCGARCEDGAAIEKGIEVVVTRYDKGIAYVRRWEEISGER